MDASRKDVAPSSAAMHFISCRARASPMVLILVMAWVASHASACTACWGACQFTYLIISSMRLRNITQNSVKSCTESNPSGRSSPSGPNITVPLSPRLVMWVPTTSIKAWWAPSGSFRSGGWFGFGGSLLGRSSWSWFSRRSCIQHGMVAPATCSWEWRANCTSCSRKRAQWAKSPVVRRCREPKMAIVSTNRLTYSTSSASASGEGLLRILVAVARRHSSSFVMAVLKRSPSSAIFFRLATWRRKPIACKRNSLEVTRNMLASRRPC
mmetsp:Transcript_13858/g.29585  ORF Transcript_13858/g.29585 Transcript_13858/m.29585 type:complete len:268 (-) Transcript_13858:1162-1965(-)